MSVFSDALQLARKPEETFKKLLKQKFSWANVFTHVNAAILVAFFLYLSGALSVIIVEGLTSQNPALFQELLVRVYGDSFKLVFILLGYNALLVLVSAFYELVVRLVGGSGGFQRQTLVLSRVFSAGALGFACVLLFNDLLHVLRSVTGFDAQLLFMITWLLGFVFFVLFAYAIYRALALIHSFGWVKGLAVFLSFFVLLFSLYHAYSIFQEYRLEQQELRVVVVGEPSYNFEYFIHTENMRLAGIMYAGKISPDFLMPGTLDSFDVVIVTGAEYCNRDALDALKQYLDDGGKMILVGNACTRVPEMEGAGWNVWGNGFDDYVPVRFVGTREINSTFRISKIDHPVVNGLTNFEFAGTIAVVELKKNYAGLGNLAFFSDNETDSWSVDAMPAIAEYHGCTPIDEHSCEGFRQIYYLSFDPGLASRELFLNILLTLKE